MASVMVHFAIIRIHFIREGPSGGTPWLWPFSILLRGSAVLIYLGVGVGASPSHPPRKTALPGDAWLNFAFSILQKCFGAKHKVTPAMYAARVPRGYGKDHTFRIQCPQVCF